MKRLLLVTMVGAALGAGAAAPVDADQELARLRPEDPAAYFRLGERLIERSDQAPRARETLALAALLASESDPTLAGGAVVALAAVARTPDERAGLWALAVDLDPVRSADRRWIAAGGGAGASDRAAAAVLGLLRLGHRDGAKAWRADADLRNRILDEGVRLGHAANRVGAVLESWAMAAAADPCGGELTLRERRGSAVVRAPCPEPQHHRGLRLDDEDVAIVLGIEMSLLGATPDSWEAQAAVGLDRAPPAWTLRRLAEAYGVSAERPVWRSGRWSAR